MIKHLLYSARGVGHIVAAIYNGRSLLFNIDPTKIYKITTDIIW